MTKETCDIIRVCKGTLNEEMEKLYPTTDYLERVKIYLAKLYDVSPEDYTEKDVSKVMLEAACDYIDTCDKPSFFLRLLNIREDENYSLSKRIGIAFNFVQVRQDGEYINGFKKEFFEEN